ncbi:unnamed protein product, partial [Adineta steineri]
QLQYLLHSQAVYEHSTIIQSFLHLLLFFSVYQCPGYDVKVYSYTLIQWLWLWFSRCYSTGIQDGVMVGPLDWGWLVG